MAEVGCLSFIASVSPLTSAIIPLAGSLLQQIIIEFYDSVTKGQALDRWSTSVTTRQSSCEHDNESLLRGVEDMQFKDIEDSCQYQAAVAAGCDFIITYNVKDYPHTLLPVFSPSDFLQHE